MSADGTSALADCKLLTGAIEEMAPLVEQAIRLSPHDPNLDLMYFRIGAVNHLQSRTDEAIVWLQKARSADPEFPLVHAWLASAYRLKREPDRAATEFIEARRLLNLHHRRIAELLIFTEVE